MSKPIVASFGSFRNQELEDLFEVIPFENASLSSPIISRVEGVVLGKIVATNKDFINNILPKMTSLKVAMPQGIGYDYMEHLFDYFKDHNVTVGSNSGQVASDTIADLTMTLLIAVARRVFQAAAMLKKGERSPMTQHTVHVTGSVMGIIGMGSIGMSIAKRAHHGFDMKILYHNRKQRSQENEDIVKATYYKNLRDMLPLCDFIVIACDLNDQSKKMLSWEEFASMKNTCILVNIARGAVVDTEALTRALQDGEIGAAGLEVTDPEPLPPSHPLWDMDNVIITPHMASSLRALRLERNRSIVSQLKQVIIHKQPLLNPII